MSKTCPLSTAVEFKACACALLDVFHTVVGSEPRTVIATTISRVPLANPGHSHLLQDVSTGWQRMPSLQSGHGSNIQDWLAGFAAEIGTVPPTREELEMLLELAGIAAHPSERPAAPITCWLVGRAGLAPRAALAAGKRLAAGSEANGS